jgi:HK97 family phage major capsid protein
MAFESTLTDTSDLAAVRAEQRAAAAYALELRARPADQRDENYDADVRSAIDVINFNDTIERALAAAERTAEQSGQRGSRGPNAAFADMGDSEFRSLGEQVVNAEGFEDWARSGGSGTSFETEVRTPVTTYTDGTAPGSGVFLPIGTPTIAPGAVRQQRLFVRDLLSTQQTGLSSVPYIQEVNSVTNAGGATTVAEGSAKPEVTMEFTQVDAPARKIAAWIPVTEEAMTDAPTLSGYINTRLTYMVMLREEAQVLSGNGNAPNIKGITQFSGVQTQSAVSDDIPATTAAAFGKIENVDGDPDGVVFNPLDYWAGVAERHSNSLDNSGNGSAPSNIAMNALSWGERSIRSRSLTAGDALAGSWKMGATLFDRTGVTVRVGNQHSDYFTKNMVAVLAEKRTALAVHRPDFFVDMTISFS